MNAKRQRDLNMNDLVSAHLRTGRNIYVVQIIVEELLRSYDYFFNFNSGIAIRVLSA